MGYLKKDRTEADEGQGTKKEKKASRIRPTARAVTETYVIQNSSLEQNKAPRI